MVSVLGLHYTLSWDYIMNLIVQHKGFLDYPNTTTNRSWRAMDIALVSFMNEMEAGRGSFISCQQKVTALSKPWSVGQCPSKVFNNICGRRVNRFLIKWKWNIILFLFSYLNPIWLFIFLELSNPRGAAGVSIDKFHDAKVFI